MGAKTLGGMRLPLGRWFQVVVIPKISKQLEPELACMQYSRRP